VGGIVYRVSGNLRAVNLTLDLGTADGKYCTGRGGVRCYYPGVSIMKGGLAKGAG